MRKEYPQYSVLMSVYYKENADWLDYSIKSMLNQTIKPSEFVLIEDGKLTEELYSVINKFIESYPDIFKVIPIKTNVGLGPALRLGIENCKYEYIARMDSDDYSMPNRIEEELNVFLENSNLSMVGTNVIEFIDDIKNGISKVILPEKQNDIYVFSKKRNPFRHPSIMFKKSAVIKAGNYREYYLFEDYDLWLRMIRSGCECYNIQEFLTFMRISSDFYKRRGGLKYLKSIYKFKIEQYKIGYITYFEFLKSFLPHAIVCLIPNNMRDFVYKKMLRK